jgi:Flp pilus assembly pilin Flp
MIQLFKNLHKEESGQDIIEYIFIAGAISIAGIAVIPTIATTVTGYWNSLSGALT